MTSNQKKTHVVILGGGFGGLYAAQALGNTDLQVTLIDKQNHHLFQPLLYQVATGGLSPGEIASPLRAILKSYPNILVLKAEATGIDASQNTLLLADGFIQYDTLIVATGVRHSYFGQQAWAPLAPGLKDIADALDIRRRILEAFETAEKQENPATRREWMRFVVVGGGATGVELAGALGELVHHSMQHNFRQINPDQVEILLVEGQERLLPNYPAGLSLYTERKLADLGVNVRKNTRVIDIQPGSIQMQNGDQIEEYACRTVLWAAGIQASGMGAILADHTGCELDQFGRIYVEPDLSLPGHPDIFIIGDLAHFPHQTGEPLPGIAPVAMQQGRYVARLIQKHLHSETAKPFRYRSKGNLAVIGRNSAVADFNYLRFSGFLAWILWVFVHIAYLIGFDNKLLVLFKWAWNYSTRNRGARLIIEHHPTSQVRSQFNEEHQMVMERN